MGGFLRGFATPLSFITFLGVGVTGILMLLEIRGPLGDVHEWLGIAFIAALLLHLIRNWRGVIAMLKAPTSKTVVGVVGAATAVLILLAIPFGGAHGGHGGRGGPWMVVNRVADAPLSTAAPALGLSGDEAVARLRSGGVEVEGAHETLAQIARDHDQPLPRLYALMLREGHDD